MKLKISTALVAAVFGAALSLAASPNHAGTQTWKGYVTDTYCGFNRVNRPPTAECTLKCVNGEYAKGAKYAFFNFADKKVYVLNPQAEAAKYAGQTVTVQGTVGGREKFKTMKGEASGGIITASSITPEKK